MVCNNMILDEYLEKIINDNEVPAIEVIIGNSQKVEYHNFLGCSSLYPIQKLNENTLFDVASLTKVIATWPGIMSLIENNELSLNTTLLDIFEDEVCENLGQITIHQLLTHTSGLPKATWLNQYGKEKSKIREGILNSNLDSVPGLEVSYNNRGFIILGFVIEKITGRKLDNYLVNNIWRPLGMNDTMYNPDSSYNIASTEFDKATGEYKMGLVHDENAEVLGGVAGHAGVFSSAHDIALFCSNILKGENLLSGDSIKNSFMNHTANLNELRGLAWDIETIDNGQIIYEHLGFTGTSINIDYELSKYLVILTNRVHPTRDNISIREIRKKIKNYVFGGESK